MSVFVGDGTTGVGARADRLGLPTGTTDPATAEAGDMYYKTDTNTIRVYDGTAWADLASGGGGVTGYTIDNSVRFDSNTSSYFNRNFSSAGNRKTFTWAGWIKRSPSPVGNIWAAIFTTSSNSFIFRFESDTLRYYDYDGATVVSQFATTSVYRDYSAWMHVVFVHDSTQGVESERLRLYVNGNRVTVFNSINYPSLNADSYGNNNVEHRIGADAAFPTRLYDGYMADIHFIDGSALAPTAFGEFDATTGVWNPIEYTGSYPGNSFHLDFADGSTAAALGTDTSGNGNTWTVNNIAVGGSVNFPGIIQPGIFSTNPAQNWRNEVQIWNDDPLELINDRSASWNGLGSGNVLTMDFSSLNLSFTSSLTIWHRPNNNWKTYYTLEGGSETIVPGTTSDWDAATISGSGRLTQIRVYGGTNAGGPKFVGLELDGVQVIGLQGTGNDNLVDSPTNGTASTGGDLGGVVVGNYATLNPLASQSGITLSDGNLLASAGAVNSGNARSNATISVSSGKWYYEVTIVAAGTNDIYGIGQDQLITTYVGADAKSYGYAPEEGVKKNNGTDTSYGSTGTTNDVFMCAFDLDNLKVFFGKNGTWFDSSNPANGTSPAFTLTSGVYAPVIRPYSSSGTAQLAVNFGQRPFAYQAPAGFVSLNTANLPTPSILNGSEYMDVALYEGNGGTLTVSGLEFAPDWTWIKSRDFTDYNMIFDRVRGAGAWLINDNVLTTPESSVNQYGVLSSFTSDGFVVTGGSINANRTNRTGIDYVSWNWYSGGGSPVSNTDGTRPSSVLVSATTGMSIVSYSGSGTANATVGHELSTPPEVIIVRNRTTAANTIVYTTVLDGSLDYFLMNGSQAALNAAPNPPTSSVFSIWSNADTGANGDNYIAYCFTQVEGYSSFGKGYTNGSPTDNGYVYTGFRPRVVWLKQSSTTSGWLVVDTARSPYNVADDRLQLSDDDAEDTTYNLMDILSNGFKLRSSAYGDAGATFFYMAWAENPFSIARAR